jgi:gamma-glutamylcyclotransferase (GGCT)/AIG2-like uncharacterized protein YtfP
MVLRLATIKHSMHLLFSYGTLQSESVQLATFSRRLAGVADRLPGYRLTRVPITDPQRAQVHGTSHYANVVPADTLAEEVCGTLLEIDDEELDVVDAYERLDGYRRIVVTAASGQRAWLYVFDAALSASRSSET